MNPNNTEYIDCFSEYTKYFLACEKDWTCFDYDECNIIFINIFNEILFENEETKRNKQISYLIFWTNFIIEKCNRNVKEPLLTTIITIVGKLDLHQLIQYAANEHDMDFSSKIDYETRKIFDENMALTDAQIEILLSIFKKKDIVFSAPTSYGKTGVVKKALLLSLEKGLINNFVAILPTNALINEYRKSINNYFKEKEIDVSIIEGPYVKPNTTKSIFLFTQERFLIFNNLFKAFSFDYILFDEAQNVINSIKKTENHREVLLAKCIAIADSLGVPKIFLMPYIKEPYNSFISNFVNLNAETLTVIDDVFSPTSSLKYLIKKIDNKFKLYDVTFHKGFSDTPKESEMQISDIHPDTVFESIKYDLYKICDSKEIDCLKEKNLFYCNKQEISDIAKLFSGNILSEDNYCCCNNRKTALINYLSEYIGDDFELIEFIKKGVCIHTGDLDSFTKRQIETLFLDEKSGVNHIFCTSTLLQGVNMNANNLFFLAKKGKFSNAVLDKKNLLGRVGRLGDCLQGRVFRFYVETTAVKFDTIKGELNASAEPCEFDKKTFSLPKKEERNEILNTYLQDKDVHNSITADNPSLDDSISCFDYFLGVETSKKVEEKFAKMTPEKITEILGALALRDYDCYRKVVEILNEIYEWEESNDFDLKHRLSKIDFTTRLFYNVAIGTSVKRLVKNALEINQKNNKKPYVAVRNGHTEVWFLSIQDYNKYKYEYKCKLRPYTEDDKNILIYYTLRNINDLIEFKFKIYLQDLYYRLRKTEGIAIENVEEFLTYSLVGGKRKIALKNIGIVDEFAVNKLAEKSELFNENVPDITKIVNYANSLDPSDPIKYAIMDMY